MNTVCLDEEGNSYSSNHAELLSTPPLDRIGVNGEQV